MQKEVYKILLIPAGQRDLDSITDQKLLVRLKDTMIELSTNPRPNGCIKLCDKDEGYRIRVGNYRFCYRIDDAAKKVFIYRIKHRKEVYR